MLDAWFLGTDGTVLLMYCVENDEDFFATYTNCFGQNSMFLLETCNNDDDVLSFY